MANLSDYIVNFESVDTLDSVTGRGSTTSNAITIGNLSSTGIDDNATSTAITIDSSENVGIGTAAPDAKIHGAGSQGSGDVPFIFENSATSGVATSSIVFAGNGGSGAEKARIKSAVYGDGYMAFHTNNDTEKMRIDANGNVGIGTASPDTTLHIQSANGVKSEINLAQTAVTNYRISVPASTDALTFLYGASTERMRIDSSGTVGIGVVPDSFNTVDGALQIGTRNTLTSFSNDIGIGYNHYYSSGWKYANADVASRFSSTSSIPFLWQYAASGSADGAITWSEAMRIDSSGDVFIKDGGELKVERSGASNFSSFYTDTGDATVINNSWSNQKIVLTRDGNVGIGTTSPSAKLHSAGNIHVGVEDNSNHSSRLKVINGGSAGYEASLDFCYEDKDTVRARINTDGSGGRIEFHTFDGSLAERMRIDANGNVGIGTSSPASPLHVNVGTNLNIEVENASSTLRLSALNDARSANIPMQFASSSFQFLTGNVDVNGDFYVGPSNNIIYESGTTFNVRATVANLTFQTNGGNERARIDSSGRFLVKKTAGGATNIGFAVEPDGNGTDKPFVSCSSAATTNSDITWAIYSTGASNYRFYVGYGGGIHAVSTSITAISDESLKENIRDLDKGLATINALQPRRFDWKNGDGNDIMGFVAQEVEDVLPELVHDYKYSEEETKLGLKMGDMIPSMVKAIQELSAQVTELKAEVAALKGA